MAILEAPTRVPGDLLEECELASEVGEIAPVVESVTRRLSETGCCGNEDLPKVRLCLEEALLNAVIHGNGARSAAPVRVSVWHDAESWGVFVRDEGAGFDPDEVDVELSEETLWQHVGRGIPLMRYHMEDVTFHDGGKTVAFRHGKTGS